MSVTDSQALLWTGAALPSQWRLRTRHVRGGVLAIAPGQNPVVDVGVVLAIGLEVRRIDRRPHGQVLAAEMRGRAPGRLVPRQCS